MIRNSSLLALALGSVLMTAAESEASTGSGGASTESAEATAAKRAAASNFLPIVRGRLPLIFVHALRFDKTLLAMSNKDAASKFATSVGKVFDIRKNRNFGYVTEGFKPTAEDVTAAQGWIDAVGAENAKGLTAAGDKTLMQNTLDQYKAAGLATAEEAAAFSAARGATRVVGEKKAPTASSGAPAAPGEGVQISTSAKTADDLLS
jgi:hypothetical protein